MTAAPITDRCVQCKQTRPLFDVPSEWASAFRRLCSPCWQTKAAEADRPGWNAECRTCDADASDHGWEDGEMTRAEAARWKRDHQCTPDVQLIAPKHSAAVAAQAERFAPGVQTLELTR